jgi:hypothetical protein
MLMIMDMVVKKNKNLPWITMVFYILSFWC